MINVEKLTNAELKQLIKNHKDRHKLSEPVFLEAMAELAQRVGHGLDFNTTLRTILAAARQRRFVCYLDIANASSVPWDTARRAIGDHLGELIAYCHGKGCTSWPLLSAIVVNKPNLD